MSAALGWLAMAFWALGAEPVLPTVGCLFIKQTVLAEQTTVLYPQPTQTAVLGLVFSSLSLFFQTVS